VRERPILFSAPMVRALLGGMKTQTRRLVRGEISTIGTMDYLNGQPLEGCSVTLLQCPYGKPGDQLWVREAWRSGKLTDRFPPREMLPHVVWYEADGPAPEATNGKLRPGMFMPRWASRITLQVTDVRVERLQDISEADAIAEGIERGVDFPGWCRGPLKGDSPGLQESGRTFRIPTAFPRLAYRALWESINGTDSWDANPWVWVLSFNLVPTP